MRHELHMEHFTLLPKRYETRRWGRGGGNINVALLGQNNTSVQAVGFGAFVAQSNLQVNYANIHQH